MSGHNEKNPHGRHKLAWGYNPGLPEGYTGPAWGCRALLEGRDVRLVPNRQDAIGPEDGVKTLLAALSGGVGAAWMRAARELPLRHNRGEEFVAYDGDNGIVVKVNTLGSHGHLHVVAYLKDSGRTEEGGA